MSTKTWFRVHSFTGVVTGLLLFVICWSGTFAVLSHEIDWLVTPEVRVTPQAERASWGQIEAAVEQRYPAALIRGFVAPLTTRSAALVRVDLPHQRSVWVYVNPYTAEVQGASSYFNVQRFFRSFHMHLFLPDRWGYYLVLLFALPMLASLLAALLFYKRWWSRFFRFKAGKGRLFWSELHKITGLWSLWFILIIVVTSFWYLFEMGRLDLGDGKVAFVGEPDFAVHVVPEPEAHADLDILPLDRLIAEAESLRPDLEIRSVSLDGDTIYVDGQASHLLVRDRANKLYLDARTGAVLHNQRASDLSLYWRWSDTADPLHFGTFGGLWTKAIWFAFGLVLSGLILTGTWLHAHRLAREAGGERRHRWPGTVASIAVSVVVLTIAFRYGVLEARGYGPSIDGSQDLPTLPVGVITFLFVWTLTTILIVLFWALLLVCPRIVRPNRPMPKRALI